MDIASKIDHTLLKPNCAESEILRICEEAKEHKFFAVCVPPVYVKIASEALNKSFVKVCTVVGFPFGYQTLEVKLTETFEALQAGAQEIDMVINISALKSGKIHLIYEEIEQLADMAHKASAILKVIIETAYLNQDEIRMMCGICADAGADYVKTSTGFADKGATCEDVEFMRSILPPGVKIKASGGIKSFEDAMKLLNSGADRLGTSSGIKILNNSAVEV